jgi:hypothetical protein
VAVLVVLVTGVLPNGGESIHAPSVHRSTRYLTAHPLRVRVTPTDPDEFNVAFTRDIGLPPSNAGWRELIDKGGVDVGQGSSDITLANRSDKPLTVRDIHVEVAEVQPAPRRAIAYKFTQGQGVVGQFAALITSATPRATAKLYKVTTKADDALEASKDYFAKNYITLQPGEIYEATLAVELRRPVMVRYRLVFSGSTPTRSFVVRNRGLLRISGLEDQDQYAHHYVKNYLRFAVMTGTCPGIKVTTWYADPRGELACPPIPHCPPATVQGVRIIGLQRTLGCATGLRLAATVANRDGYFKNAYYYCRAGQGGTKSIRIRGDVYTPGFCYRVSDEREASFLVHRVRQE